MYIECMYVHACICIQYVSMYEYVCMYICVCIDVYVCMYVYMYVHMYLYSTSDSCLFSYLPYAYWSVGPWVQLIEDTTKHIDCFELNPERNATQFFKVQLKHTYIHMHTHIHTYIQCYSVSICCSRIIVT